MSEKSAKNNEITIEGFSTVVLSRGKYLNNNCDLPKNYLFNTVLILSRMMLGEWKHEIFSDCLSAAERADAQHQFPLIKKKYRRIAGKYISKINNLDAVSVTYTVRLVGFIAAERNMGKSVEELINYTPSNECIYNIIEMVTRVVEFLKNQGKMIDSWFEFKDVEATRLRQQKGHFLTEKGLWIITTAEKSWTKMDVLTIVCHYLMAQQAGNIEGEKIKEIGIINPRVNIAYKINVDNISENILKRAKNKIKYKC